MTAFESALSLHGGLFGALRGFAAAIALTLLLAWVLPAALRSRLRAPLLFASLSVLLRLSAEMLAQDAGPHLYVRAFALLFILLAFTRLVLLALIDWLLIQQLHRDPPKILRDIFEGVAFIAAVLISLRAAGMDPTSLLTTSALLTAIIGLSMQDTLGNLFAGLSLQAERPFEIGDWIQHEQAGKYIGQVTEISWRATKIRTQDNIDIVIPNGQLARLPILNHSRQRIAVRRSVHVTVPHDVPTRRAQEVILEALRDASGVLTEPAPSVLTFSFDPNGIQLWVRFFITEFDHRDGIDGRVRDRIWYALQRAGIPLASSAHRVEVRQDSEEAQERAAVRAQVERVAALRGLPLFRDLSDDALAALARGARALLYETGETVVRQGEQGEELYLCLRGELAVVHLAANASVGREVATLQPGGVFGELSLLTGAPRSASVIAKNACELLAIGKSALAPVLSSQPALAEQLSVRLAERQAELDALATVERPSERGSLEERKGQLLSRIKQFFSLR